MFVKFKTTRGYAWFITIALYIEIVMLPAPMRLALVCVLGHRVFRQDKNSITVISVFLIMSSM